MTVSVISENTTRTYAGVQDTTLYEYDPTSPFFDIATQMEVSSKTVGDRGHVLLEFTGLSNITSSDSVSAVNLELNVITGTASQGVSIYEMLTVPTYGQASWNNRLTATAWTTAGALNSTDVNTTALETQTEAGNTTPLNFTSTNLKNLVQTKVTAGAVLRLLICRSNDIAYDASGVVFQSSEGTDTLRPKLTVTHTAGGPTVSTVSSNSANEGTAIVHTVTLSAAVSGSAAVYAITLAGGTATGGGTDYTSVLTNGMFSNSVTVSGGNITVPIGVSSFTVTIPTTTDALVEGAETYTLTIGGTAGTGTINDLVVFTVNSVDLGSFTGFATFTVTASATSGSNRDIVCTTSNGTAAAGVDYTATTQTVTILAGNLTADFLVPIINTRKPDTVLVSTGWTVTGAADAAAALADNDDASYTTSPAITGSQGPLKTQMLPTPLAAGTHTYSFNAQEFNGDCQVRISLLDGSDVSQGNSGWISLTASLATYSATITTTGSSTRFLVEVQ